MLKRLLGCYCLTIYVELSVRDNDSTSCTVADVNNISVSDLDISQMPPASPETKPAVDVSLGALQRISQKIDEGPPPLPSVCQYTLLNTYQG